MLCQQLEGMEKAKQDMAVEYEQQLKKFQEEVGCRKMVSDRLTILLLLFFEFCFFFFLILQPLPCARKENRLETEALYLCRMLDYIPEDLRA